MSDIDFVSEDKRIKSVNYCSGSKKHSVNADAVIISAGALGTPLLVKKVISAIGSSCDNVGTGLADHPIGFIGKVKFKKHITKSMNRLSALNRGNYICEWETSLAPNIRTELSGNVVVNNSRGVFLT